MTNWIATGAWRDFDLKVGKLASAMEALAGKFATDFSDPEPDPEYRITMTVLEDGPTEPVRPEGDGWRLVWSGMMMPIARRLHIMVATWERVPHNGQRAEG